MDLSQIGNLSSSQKDQLMSEVKQQIAVANAQELLTVSFQLPQHHKYIATNDFVLFAENDRKVFQKMC